MGSTSSNYKINFTEFHNVINNKLTSTPQTRHGIDPSTEAALPEVPVAGAADVDHAVAAATAAFSTWRATSWDERGAYVAKLADAIEANSDDFRDLLVSETGKAVSTAGLEVMLSLGHLRATAALRLPDDVVEDSAERTAAVRYRPLGVGAAIVPWNWPMLLGVGKIGPGVMAGNTVIVKPSPYAPYTLLKIVELAATIFPPGVIQVLSSDEPGIGPLLTAHPGIAKVSFTGSTQTGKLIAAACAKTLKRVTLELGGNDAVIVRADADIAKVVPKIATLSFISSGQICMNVKRIYVHATIYDAFLAAMVAFVRDNLKPGPAADPATGVGPVQNKMQYGKVLDLFEDSERQGYTIALGGLKDVNRKGGKGFILPPTIVSNPPDDARIVVEEPFGPIVPVMKWTEDADVVRRLNTSDMGLGASVWGADIPKASAMADQLEAGSVWVNTHFELSPNMPFGGHKSSGIGMEWGIVGLKGWTNAQAFWTRKD